MTSARRVVALAFGAAALIAGAVAFGLFPQEPIRRLVEARLRKAAGPSARVGRVEILPARLEAVVEDLSLQGPGYAIDVPRLRAALSPETLLGRRLSLRILEMDSPRLVLRPQGLGSASGPAPTPPPAPWIQKAVVTGGAMSVETPGEGTLSVRGVEIRWALPAGSLDVSLAGGDWNRPGHPLAPLGPGRLELRVSPAGGVRLESLQASTPLSRVSASGPLGRVGSWDPHVDFEARLDLSEAEGLGAPPMRGVLEARGHWDGLGSGGGRWALGGRGLQVAGVDVASVEASFKRTGAETQGFVTAEVLGGHLQGEGRQTGPRSVGTLRLTGLDLSAARRAGLLGLQGQGSLSTLLSWDGDLGGSLGLEGSADGSWGSSGASATLHGSVSGTFRAAGRTVDVHWRATAEAEAPDGAPPRLRSVGLSAEGTALGPWPPDVAGRIEGTLRGTGSSGPLEMAFQGSGQGRLEGSWVAEGTASGLGGVVTGSLEVGRARIERGTLEATGLNLGALLPGAAGVLGARVAANGPTDHLQTSADFRIEGAGWRGAVVGPVLLGWTGTGSEGRLRLEVPDMSLRGSGTVRGRGSSSLSARLEFEATPFAPLSPLLPPGTALKGVVSGVATLEAPLGVLASAQGDARIDSLEAEARGVSVRTLNAFHVALRADALTFEDVALAGPGVEFHGTGRLGRLPGAPLDVRARARIDLAQAPLGEALHREGELDLDLHAVGSRARPQVHGTLKGRRLSLQAGQLPVVAAQEALIELEGDRAVLPGLVLDVAQGGLTLSGTVPLASILPAAREHPERVAPSEEAHLRASWSRIQWGALLARPGAAEPSAPLAGVLEGEAEIDGGLAALREPRGHVTLPAATVTLSDLSLELAPATVRLQDGRLTTDGLSLGVADGVFRLGGGLDLAGRTLDGTAQGRVDLRVLSPFLTGVSLTGAAEANLSFQGTLEAPRTQGTLRVKDGSARLREIPQALTSLNAALTFDGSTIVIDSASGLLGGGPLSAAGSATLHGMKLAAVNVTLKGQDMSLRYPPGLKSRINADLALTGGGRNFALAGKVNAVRGLYDIDVAVQENLFAPVAPAARSPLLAAIALDISAQTENPVLVRNNMARLEATGDLSLRGDLESPAPFGRVDLRPDGRVYFQGQDFAIRSGSLTYGGTWNPAVSVTMEKTIRDTETLQDVTVTAAAGGGLMDLDIHLSSEPPLSEAQLIRLIATGSTAATVNEAALAGGAAGSLLIGRASQSLLKGLGLGDVSVRPELLARETSPGARFTFGKQISPTLDLIYSLGLNDPEQRFVRVEWHAPHSVNLSVQRDDGGTVTPEGGQTIRWGGTPARTEHPLEAQVRLAEVRFEGETLLSEADLRRGLRSHPGAHATAFDLQDDADRLRARLVNDGFIEAEVGARLEGPRAVFRIRTGARYRWRVEGMAAAPDLGAEIRKALFAEEAEERGRARLLRELSSRGRWRAVVSTETKEEEGVRTLLFKVEAGPPTRVAGVLFPGASHLSPGALLDAAGGPAAFLVAPAEASKKLEALYGGAHFLKATVGPAEVRQLAGGLQITVPVREGPRARLASVAVEGSSLPEEERKGLTKDLEPGAEVSEAAVTAAGQRIRDRYLSLGYGAIRVRAILSEVGPDLGVTFSVSEGRRSVLGSVRITGLRRTRESLVRAQVDLKPGDPLDPRRLLAIERRLLDLGTFSRVSLTPTAEDPSVLEIAVEEGPVVTAAYDARYNTTDHATALVDAEIHDLLGRGLDIGARYRRGSQIREARASLHLPALAGGNLVASAFRVEQDFAATDLFTGEAITNVQIEKGFELQENLAFKSHTNLLLGYRWRRTESTVFPVPVTVAGLTVSVFRDTRDNLLDARSGRFLSLSLEFSPQALGSDLTFVKGYAQAFLVRSLGSSWTWAQGYRLGLAQGFGGQMLVSTDRFKAGGADTLRGFGTGEVGPVNFLGEATGGQAALIVNEELRYHRPSGLGGALFYDAGNVFDTVHDLSLRLRHAVGFGVRYQSPVGLLRLDLGLPLARREGEKAYRVFFSLGQAF